MIALLIVKQTNSHLLQNAVSDTEEPDTATSQPQPISTDSAPPTTDSVDNIQPEEVDISPSQAAVSNILSKFAALKSDFKFPATLDFLNSPEADPTTTPKLAYTPNNAPLHQYEHLLTGLLTQLDAVESFGQESVRKARKDVVKAIEQELGELDARKLQEWRRQFPPTESTIPLVDSEMSVVESQIPAAGDEVPVVEKEAPKVDTVPESDSQTQPPQNAPATVETSATADDPITEGAPQNANVDPASIPLPLDEDQEMRVETTSVKLPDTPFEPAAPSEPVAASLPQSSDAPPPVENTEQSELSATPVPTTLEPATKTPATSSRPEPEVTSDRVDPPSVTEPKDTDHDANDTKNDSR